MLKKALIASLICLGGLFSSSAAPTLGGPTLSATGGSTNSSSGGVDTNAVIALIEQYGGGGGVVSNTVVQLTVDTWYTNGQYPVVVEAQIELPNSAALMLFSVKDTNSAVIGYLPGSAAWNEFGNASKYAFATTTATEDNVQSLGGYVPAYAAFRYYASGTTASIYDNAPNGTRLVYFGSGTNSGSGSGVSAAQVAAIMQTNLAYQITNKLIYYVRTNGNNSTAAVGREDTAWQTITPAVAAANAAGGGIVHIGIGQWQESMLALTNITLLGHSRSVSTIVYTNAAFAFRTHGNCVVQNLALFPAFTNAALTYPLVVRTGSLISRGNDAKGMSDIGFPDPLNPAEPLFIEYDGDNQVISWDAMNLIVCSPLSTFIVRNVRAYFVPSFSGQARRFIAGVHGHNVYVTGSTIINTNGNTDDTILAGGDMSNVYFAGCVISNSGPFVAAGDNHGGPNLAGVYYNGGALPDRFNSGKLQPTGFKLMTPWLNGISVYATNKSVAYRGKTLGVTGAGTTSANGLYVFSYGAPFVDNNWGLREMVWTNTANSRLKIIAYDTNETTYVNQYQLFTNGNASATASSLSWTLLYSSDDWNNAWTVNGGASSAPVVSNYAPALAWYQDTNPTHLTNTVVYANDDFDIPALTIGDLSEFSLNNYDLFAITNAGGGKVVRMTSNGDIIGANIQAGTVTATSLVGRPYGHGGSLTNLQATNIVGSTGTDFGTNYYSLTYSGGTNVVIDCSLASYFQLSVTNNTWLIWSNVHRLNNQGGAVHLQMNATGGYSVLAYTNNLLKPSGQWLTTATNANAVSSIGFYRGPFTGNTNVLAIQSLNFLP